LTPISSSTAGGPHPEREACIELLQRVSDGSLDATVDAEVVQEVLFVLVRRGRLRDGLRLARDVLALFPGLFPVTSQDMLRACGLLERYPTLPVRDAIHVATMLNNGLKTVVSVDADFDQVVEIRRVAPGSA
jgi:uncharacterized protein